MRLIIKNLPSDISPEILWDCLEACVPNKSLFNIYDDAGVKAIKIIERNFRETSGREMHAIVSLSSETAGKMILKSEKTLNKLIRRKTSFSIEKKPPVSASIFQIRWYGRDPNHHRAYAPFNSETRSRLDKRRLDGQIKCLSEITLEDKKSIDQSRRHLDQSKTRRFV